MSPDKFADVLSRISYIILKFLPQGREYVNFKMQTYITRPLNLNSIYNRIDTNEIYNYHRHS